MASPIFSASSVPLNAQGSGNLPNVSGALQGLFQAITFIRVTKLAQGFQVLETGTAVDFRGVVQPLTAQRLLLKPEGQRAWKWLWLHAEASLVLTVDEVVIYGGTPTRVMSVKDYSAYGYAEYELCQDWTGSSPVVAP